MRIVVGGPTPTPTPSKPGVVPPGGGNPPVQTQTGDVLSGESWTRKDYRWVTIEWDYPSGSSHTYTEAQIQWSNNPADGLQSVRSGSHQPPAGPRAVVSADATSAEIRGIPWDSAPAYYVRVRGLTAAGKKSDWSQYIQVYRDADYYYSYGHQHDHKVSYALSTLTTDIYKMLNRATERAAALWNKPSLVRVCEAPCDPGDTDDLVRSAYRYVPEGPITSISNHTYNNRACGDSVACVAGVNIHDRLHVHLTGMTIEYERPAVWGTGMNPAQHHQWTDDPGKVNKWTGNTNNPDQTYILMLPIAVHEFGHTLGLPDYYLLTTPNHDGIMNVGYTAPQPDDWLRLRELYKDHAPDQGW